MVTKGSNGDGKDFDAMVKQAGAENLREGVHISREGKVVGSYKDLNDALSEYVKLVKESMGEKLPYSKPTLVNTKGPGNDGPILS